MNETIPNIYPFEQLLNEKADIMLPYGYEVENSRLYRVTEDEKKKFVCDYVPRIDTIYINERDTQTLWTISWLEQNQEMQYLKLIPKGTFATSSRIIELYEKGLSVTSDNSAELVRYFQRYEAEFKNEIEKKYAYDQLGYVKGGFLLPNQFISADSKQDVVFQASGGNADFVKGYEESGTLEEWLKNVFEPIKTRKIPLFYTLASIGSPVMNRFNLSSMMADLSFGTTAGKSTTMLVANSAWGSRSLIDTWMTTQAGAERRAAMLNHLPYFMDDTRNTKLKPDELSTLIYTLASGKEKTRSGLKDNHISRTWNNFILSTGEQKITEYSKAGGSVARVLAIHEQAIEYNIELISQLEHATLEYYGTAGIAFLKWFVQQDLEPYKKSLEQYKTYYEGKTKNHIMQRLAKHMAFIRLVADMAQSAFGVEINTELINEYWLSVVESNLEQANRPLQALRDTMELASRNRGKFYEKSEEKVFPIDNAFGELHKSTNRLCFERAFLEDYLQSRGYEPNTVLRQWKERKYLMTRSNENTTSMVVDSVYEKKKKRFYCIDLTHEVLREEAE